VEDIALLFVIDMAGDDGVKHYENLDLIAVTTHLQHPKYSSIKVCYFLTIKVEVKGFEYLILLFYSVKMKLNVFFLIYMFLMYYVLC
jgi:hypothetical protein